MRRFLIAGNWKMNKTVAETNQFMDQFLPLLNAEQRQTVDVLICPPHITLPAAQLKLAGSGVCWGAQNCHAAEKGAYTGEVSTSMLTSVGCSHVIIGHSERRQMFGENNQSCAEKINSVAAAGMLAIYCVGESLEERQAAQTEAVLKQQIREALNLVDSAQAAKLIIAYEPVWAIGTGLAATSEQAEEAHAYIRSLLREVYSAELAESIRILYGGSMKPSNADELLRCSNVDGGLVGGASLQADSFAELVHQAAALTRSS